MNRKILFCILIFAIAGACNADSQSNSAIVEKTTSPQNQSIVGSETHSETVTTFMSEETSPHEQSRLAEFKAIVQKTNIIHIFEKGGPIMWPLLIASILAMGTVIERVFFLFIEWCRRDRKALRKFLEAVQRADMEQAALISKKSNFYVVRVLGYALTHRETSLGNALLYAQEEELKRFRRGIPMLDTIITLAPLLGLLGTVTGMMGSFSLIGGELSAPGAITGGIAEALIATAFGLGIAITSLLPFNFLNTKMENAGLEMESAATQLELLMHPQKKKTTANGADDVELSVDEVEKYVQLA
jgi:biopolymer transport protein ExbB